MRSKSSAPSTEAGLRNRIQPAEIGECGIVLHVPSTSRWFRCGDGDAVCASSRLVWSRACAREKPDAEGDRADPEGLRCLARCQVLPGDEEERLAVELREPAKSALQGRIELERAVGRRASRRPTLRGQTAPSAEPPRGRGCAPFRRATAEGRRQGRRRVAARRWSSPRPRSRPDPCFLASARRP